MTAKTVLFIEYTLDNEVYLEENKRRDLKNLPTNLNIYLKEMLTVKTDRKKDIIYISLILISFLGLVLWLSISKYYGSKTDWYSQHVSFAEYFRWKKNEKNILTKG